MDNIKTQLFRRFYLKDLGALIDILNIEITRTVEDGLFLSQSLYVTNVPNRFAEFVDSKSSKLNKMLIL